jgi:hypothetical protein
LICFNPSERIQESAGFVNKFSKEDWKKVPVSGKIALFPITIHKKVTFFLHKCHKNAMGALQDLDMLKCV